MLTEVIEGPQRKDIGKVLIIKVGNNYHNNHDSSYHQWLNDLVIWNIWRVQDYNNAPKVFTIFKVVESQ